MFTIERATAEDFERVYPQLRHCFGDSLLKEDWKKIFVTRWQAPEDFCGYILLNDEQVKGYLGLLFSSRVVDDKIERFCNLTSWCVSDDSRAKSLSLLLEALKLKHFTFTNFTASPTVATISGKLGFKSFTVDQRVLLPVPHLVDRRFGCDFDLEVVRSKLSENDLRIFDDHQGINCEHLLLRSDNGDCYVVLKKTVRKRLSFAKVHYLSNLDVFHECMERLIARICLRLRVFGVMVDERYIEGRPFRASVRYPHQQKAYFKSTSIAHANRIDTLYSEAVVLHN